MGNLTVQHLCKLFDVAPQTVHIYEKYGIIKSNRDLNNYRKYDRKNIQLLLRSKFMQKFGFTLKEIKNMLHEYDVNEVMKETNQRLYNLEKEIEELNKQKEKLQYIIGITNSNLENTGKLEFKISPEFYFYSVYESKNDAIRKIEINDKIREEINAYSHDWMIIRQEQLENDKIEVELALSITPKAVEMIPSLKDMCEYFPKKMILLYYGKTASNDYIPPKEDIKMLKEYIRENGYCISGDAFVKPGIITNNESFYKIYIPVEPF